MHLLFLPTNFLKRAMVKSFIKALVIFGLPVTLSPIAANAEIAGLTDCGESQVFQKRLAKTVRKLEGRLKKYDEASAPRLAIQQQIEQTKKRFERYSESNILCGSDGLPHLITDGRWSHAAEFILPSILFLYITGWIGWVGRKYLQLVSKTSNPTEKEIIIDVPLAASVMSTGFGWPVAAWNEFAKGELLASDDSITVSPR
jgi:photosystem I subunit 3